MGFPEDTLLIPVGHPSATIKVEESSSELTAPMIPRPRSLDDPDSYPPLHYLLLTNPPLVYHLQSVYQLPSPRRSRPLAPTQTCRFVLKQAIVISPRLGAPIPDHTAGNRKQETVGDFSAIFLRRFSISNECRVSRYVREMCPLLIRRRSQPSLT